MNKLTQFVTKFAREEDGVTAIEYGLIAALIAVVIIGAVTAVGGADEDSGLRGVFNRVAEELGSVLGG